MKTWNRCLLCAALALIAAGLSLSAQAQIKPLMRLNLEEGDGGWTVIGSNAKAAITNDAANVEEGKGALQFDYTIGKGEMGVLVLPTPNGAVAKAKALHFWIKSDHAAPMIAGLQEKDGGRY